MKEPKFKRGDWCFFEFKLHQIIETEENRITSVSDGVFRCSGYDLSDRCYPVEMKIKQISDTVAYWSDRIQSLNNNALNHPDLNRELIRRWVEICDSKDDDDRVYELQTHVAGFVNAVISKVNDLKSGEVCGVSVFRN